MGVNLEHQLGELNGQLKALVPALTSMENRLRDSEARLAGAEARHEALRREFDEYKGKTARRIGELFQKAENAATGIGDAKNAAATAQSDVNTLKQNREGFGKKIWDVVKILLGGGLGAFLTYLLGRKGP